MQILFMDAHVLVTRCCSYPCIPECFHFHLLHCIHCIASVQGESQLQGELDVCMCQQGGEVFGERSDRTRGCLIFELVVHRALRVHTCGESCTCEGKMHFRRSFCFVCGSWFPRFPSASCMTASSVTSVFEESCFGF